MENTETQTQNNLAKMVEKVSELYEKYKSDPYMEQKMNNYILICYINILKTINIKYSSCVLKDEDSKSS
jgi:hypothetical protein